jgi:hypothetical protein
MPRRIGPRRPGAACGRRWVGGRAGAPRDGDFGARGEGGARGPGGEGQGLGPRGRGRGGGISQEVRRLGDVRGLDELVAVLEAPPPPAAADRRGRRQPQGRGQAECAPPRAQQDQVRCSTLLSELGKYDSDSVIMCESCGWFRRLGDLFT